MDDRLQLALELARKCGAIIKANFGKDHSVELKGDMSPVTVIDKEINALVAKELKAAFPQDGLLGEEESYGSGQEKYQWICDPLDGTKAFILELPNSLFLLGMSEDGTMLLSVAYDPYADKMYHAVRGKGAFCNNQLIHVNSAKMSEGYSLIGADALGLATELQKRSLGVEPAPGTGYKCMMIASGKATGMVHDNADFHDIGPCSLIVEEAGGKVANFHGENPRFNGRIGGVVITNSAAHGEFLELVQAWTAT